MNHAVLVGQRFVCGITSDADRADDPRYIVDLVGRVITVSLETVKIVEALPEQYSEAKV